MSNRHDEGTIIGPDGIERCDYCMAPPHERAALLKIAEAAKAWIDAEDGDDPIEKCDGYMATREALSDWHSL